MRPAATALLLALGLLVAACSGGAEEAATPEGYEVHERDGFRVATPEGWQVRTDQPGRLEVIGTREVAGSIEAVDVKVGPISGDFDAAILGAIDPFRLSVDGYELLDEGEVPVPGADRGYRFDATYQDADAAQPTRQWDVFAADEGGDQVVYISLKAPAEVFDEAQMQQILDSLAVTDQ